MGKGMLDCNTEIHFDAWAIYDIVCDMHPDGEDSAEAKQVYNLLGVLADKYQEAVDEYQTVGDAIMHAEYLTESAEQAAQVLRDLDGIPLSGYYAGRCEPLQIARELESHIHSINKVRELV